jgi:hypothetical protein
MSSIRCDIIAIGSIILYILRPLQQPTDPNTGNWNCSSCFATCIQKKQPLLEEAWDKNSMHHKRVVRK